MIDIITTHKITSFRVFPTSTNVYKIHRDRRLPRLLYFTHMLANYQDKQDAIKNYIEGTANSHEKIQYRW